MILSPSLSLSFCLFALFNANLSSQNFTHTHTDAHPLCSLSCVCGLCAASFVVSLWRFKNVWKLFDQSQTRLMQNATCCNCQTGAKCLCHWFRTGSNVQSTVNKVVLWPNHTCRVAYTKHILIIKVYNLIELACQWHLFKWTSSADRARKSRRNAELADCQFSIPTCLMESAKKWTSSLIERTFVLLKGRRYSHS